MFPHQFFKLLADETRVRCLLMIAREEKVCVAELTHALNETQPKISRHLALLRVSGVVVDTRQGQWVFYRLSDQLPGWMKKQIQGLVESDCLKREYQADILRISEMQSRPTCCISETEQTTGQVNRRRDT
ncbi:metalloregulator ArsR/SmtB family transcription factor [Vibrio sp. HDW18]|uniref:metalloregulator ArsR/SmtB family transcription factor n=1 Tax=Vibrio sp. HDW18 TaxID=2714948 RepID=UPI00140AD8C6|nr:metalloregulator ArsR/SmtB family transcription factor [Vibrio sp. HDW18]QIL86487.1 metalloregulator ArsR/SmtB family transcription factor [Vibrio sp. HDW18]